MKLCIPTETNEGLNAPVCGHFGTAPFFTVINSDTGDVEKIIEHNNEHHGQGGCTPVGLLQQEGIEAVVVQGMGFRAVQRLKTAGIQAYVSRFRAIGDVLDAFRSGTLAEMTEDNSCSAHGCH